MFEEVGCVEGFAEVLVCPVAEEVGQGLCVEEGLLKRGRIGYFCRPG